MLSRSRNIFIVLMLLLASPIVAQDIGGLSTLPVLSEGRYPVRGLAVPTGSLDELSKWAQRLVVAANGPDGAEHSIEVDIGLVKRQPVLYFSADKAGLYVLMLVDTGAKDTSVILSKRITVGEVVPPTPNPPPPGPPTPPPVPPAPPVPIVQPFPVPGFRLLVVYESDPATSKPKLTQEQGAILTGAAVRQLLSTRCVKDSKGAPEFRFFDEDADMANAAKHWQDAMKRPRRSLPWLIISDGIEGWEGPLPETVAKFTELIGVFRN